MTKKKQKPKIKVRLYCPACGYITDRELNRRFCPICNNPLRKAYLIADRRAKGSSTNSPA